jgi:hypothetical protein
MTPRQALLYARQNPSLRHNVCKYVQSSDIALQWAILFPEDKDIMRDRINEDYWVLRWAIEWPEDRDIMRDRINDSQWTFFWVKKWPEDKHIMRNQIKDPKWAFLWLIDIGPDPDILEICKKDKEIYNKALEFILHGR